MNHTVINSRTLRLTIDMIMSTSCTNILALNKLLSQWNSDEVFDENISKFWSNKSKQIDKSMCFLTMSGGVIAVESHACH
jgi:hypothetical protein